MHPHVYTFTHFKPATDRGIQVLAQLSDHGKQIQNLWSLRPLRPGPAKGCL